MTRESDEAVARHGVQGPPPAAGAAGTYGAVVSADAQSATPFSLVLPVYAGDKAAYLRRAFVSSVDEQELPPDEVVIVVDGPIPDDVREVLVELRRATPVSTKVVELPENLGLTVALTRGLEACRHDVIARMDADDVSLPQRFVRQVEALRSGLDLVGTAMYEFDDDDGLIIGKRVPPTSAEQIQRYARFHDPFNHPTVMYRREAVLAAGGYRPMGLMEDYWLFARMLQSGARVANLEQPLVMYRVGDGAYDRRGGWRQLKAELSLQAAFRRSGFTTGAEYVRNVAVRGGYRLVPVGIRRAAYRRFIARGGSASATRSIE